MEEAKGTTKSQISSLLPISGVTAALTIFCYIFGSLYIQRYYGFFGIPSGALNFSLQDYISHSLLPLIVAVQLGIWAELLYYNIRHNYFLGFNLTRTDQIRKDLEAQRKLSIISLLRGIYKDAPHDSIMNILMLLIMTSFSTAWVVWVIVRYIINEPVEGMLAAYIFSLAIGVLYFISTQVAKLLYSQTYRDFGLVQLISSIVSISMVYILAIGLIANMQANYDVDKFPKVVIASRTQLPNEITHLPGTPNLSKILRVVTVNNNRVYVYLDEEQNGRSKGKAFTVYAIDCSSIDYFKYMSSTGSLE